MSIWTCLKCTARYAVGLARCPQCESTEHTDDPDRAQAAPAEAAPEQPAAAQRRAKATQTPDSAAMAVEPAQDGGKP